MATYKYKGVSMDGVNVSGTIKAYDENEAMARLRETCSFISKIEEYKESTSILNKKIGSTKIKEKDLALICSQFSIIISSGLPVVRCVEMVAEQTKDKELKSMLEKVAEAVDSGFTLAQAFEKNGKDLPTTFIETIRAGEESGALELCFKRLYTYFDKSAKTKAKVKNAMTYPIMVMVVAAIVFVIIMVVAVPMFISTFEELEVELPGITKALIAVSKFFTNYWWCLALVVLAAYIFFYFYKKTDKGKLALSKFSIYYSPLKKINSMNLSVQFSSTMAIMISAGIPITRALEITSAVVNNYIYSKSILMVKNGVEQGRSLFSCMSGISVFSPMLTEMTGVGERSGSMEETLEVISDYFSNDVDLSTAKLLSMMEPIITVVLAVVTVILLLAVYLPMFNMYGSV